MLVWTDELSVSVVEIDDQHKELFTQVNRLVGVLDASAAEAELRTLFSFLEEYVVKHFGAEERYMDDYAMYEYADAERHKAEHRAFIRDLHEFKVDLEGADSGALFIEEFKRWIYNWLVTHIKHVDKGLGRFLQSAFPLLGKKSAL